MSYQLTIEPLGVCIDVAPGQTLLDAALRQGFYLPHACGHGLCGSCKVQVLDGEVDHGGANPFALMDVEREEGKTLACCATLMDDAVIEAELDEDPDARVLPVRDYPGTVVQIEAITPTIKRLRLALDTPLDFQAGQYLQVDIPGLSGAQGRTRAFSIANPPSEVLATGQVELHVRQVPNGAGTTYLHEQLRVGDGLRVSGPYGRFFVRRSAAKPMLFLAGGSGLSSPRSMILDLLEQGGDESITLIVGQRCQAELYDDALFRDLAVRHPRLHYVPTLSNEPEGSDWAGHRGAVHSTAQALFPQGFAGHSAYLCGPPPMVEACVRALMQGRLFERDIYTERFLSAADAGAATRSPLFQRV